jgi:hypothetical protein
LRGDAGSQWVAAACSRAVTPGQKGRSALPATACVAMHCTSKRLPSAPEQAEQDQEMAGHELMCSLKWPLPKLSRLSLAWYNLQSPTSNSQLPNTQRPRINVGSISTRSPHKSRRVRCRRRRSSRSQKKEAPRTTIQQTAILSKTCTRNSNRKNQTHNARSSQFCLQAAELLPLNTQRPTPKHSSPKHPTPNAREPTWKAAERPTPSQHKPPTQQWRPQAAQAVVATSDLKNSNTTALANNGCYTRKMRKDLRMVWTWRCQKSEVVIGIGIERAIC